MDDYRDCSSEHKTEQAVLMKNGSCLQSEPLFSGIFPHRMWVVILKTPISLHITPTSLSTKCIPISAVRET